MSGRFRALISMTGRRRRREEKAKTPESVSLRGFIYWKKPIRPGQSGYPKEKGKPPARARR
jgi:hypothetical protein